MFQSSLYASLFCNDIPTFRVSDLLPEVKSEPPPSHLVGVNVFYLCIQWCIEVFDKSL